MKKHVSMPYKILESNELTITEKGFLACIYAGVSPNIENDLHDAICWTLKAKGYVISDGKIYMSQENYILPKKSHSKNTDDEHLNMFEEFWGKVPRASKRAGKHKPLQIWRRLTDEERAAALKVVDVWCSFEERKDDPSLVPHLATWLNQKRWEAFEEALNDGNH